MDKVLPRPITINIGYIAGGIAMGWSNNRLPVKLRVVLVLVIAGVSILAVGFTGSPIQAFIALGFVGVAYGGMAAVYAVAVRRFCGRQTRRANLRAFTLSLESCRAARAVVRRGDLQPGGRVRDGRNLCGNRRRAGRSRQSHAAARQTRGRSKII